MKYHIFQNYDTYPILMFTKKNKDFNKLINRLKKGLFVNDIALNIAMGCMKESLLAKLGKSSATTLWESLWSLELHPPIASYSHYATIRLLITEISKCSKHWDGRLLITVKSVCSRCMFQISQLYTFPKRQRTNNLDILLKPQTTMNQFVFTWFLCVHSTNTSSLHMPDFSWNSWKYTN